MIKRLPVRECGAGASPADATSNRENSPRIGLTFAALMPPIVAYSLTSDTMTQTELWEMANYTVKPRLQSS